MGSQVHGNGAEANPSAPNRIREQFSNLCAKLVHLERHARPPFPKGPRIAPSGGASVAAAIRFELSASDRMIRALSATDRVFMRIVEDLKAQREGLLGLGFWAITVYRFGHARFVIRNKILRAPWTIAYIILSKFIEITCGITIGATARIGRRLSIEHHGCIVIHGAVEIGDDCLLRHGVTAGNVGASDPQGAPKIGNRVQMGAGAKLIGRITIGDDVIIGANAVVTRDVPAGAIVVGIPARIVKMRDLPVRAPDEIANSG